MPWGCGCSYIIFFFLNSSSSLQLVLHNHNHHKHCCHYYSALSLLFRKCIWGTDLPWQFLNCYAETKLQITFCCFTRSKYTASGPTSPSTNPVIPGEIKSVPVSCATLNREESFVCWLLNVPATCECISGTDLLRQFYVLPHWDRSCRPNFPSYPVTVYWHRANF